MPRDPRGIVLLCGFVAAAALGISALLFGDPIGYGYLAASVVGYLFLQTRLVPTTFWLLISFGGAASATAGNTSGWVVCGLALLLAMVSLLQVPAAFRGESSKAKAPQTLSGPSPSAVHGAPEPAASGDSSRNLEVSPIRTSRNPEVGAFANGEQPANGVIATGPLLDSLDPVPGVSTPGAVNRLLAGRVVVTAMGRLRLEANSRDLTQRLNEQPRLEFLFSYLLARTTRGADAAIDRPALADEVAPSISTGSQRDRLRKQLYALQSALGPELKGLLRVTNTHIRLDLTGVEVDFVALEQMSRRLGKRHSLIDGELAEQIRLVLQETAGGEFLAGFSELEQQVTAGRGVASQIVDDARALIATWRADLVLALAEYQEAVGHPQASITYLQSALAQSPQRQDLARLLVAAYVQTGQMARATETRLEYELIGEK